MSSPLVMDKDLTSSTFLREVEKNNNNTAPLAMKKSHKPREGVAVKEEPEDLPQNGPLFLPAGLRMSKLEKAVETSSAFSANATLGPFPINIARINKLDDVENLSATEESCNVDNESKWILCLLKQQSSRLSDCNCTATFDAFSGCIQFTFLRDVDPFEEVVPFLNLNQTTIKSNAESPPNVPGQLPSEPQVSTGTRRDKQCVYCKISFSSYDTLQAHMSNYCSKRPERDNLSPQNNLNGKLLSSLTDKAKQKSLSENKTRRQLANEAVVQTTPQLPCSDASSNNLSNKQLVNDLTLQFFLSKMNELFNQSNATPQMTQTAQPKTPKQQVQPPFPQITPLQTSSDDQSVDFDNGLGTKKRKIDEFQSLRENGPHFCSTCQRFFDSRHLFISHILMSRKIYEIDAKNREGTGDPQASPLSTSIFHLSSSAQRLGLTLAAPLHSTNGCQYIPINPNCGRTGNSCDRKKPVYKDPHTEINDQQQQRSVLEVSPSEFGMPNAGFEQGGSYEQDKLISAFFNNPATLLSLINTLSTQSPLAKPLSSSSSLQGQASNSNPVNRPYLCSFCQTRFQALSTFQAHQKFYCQGRKRLATNSNGSSANEEAKKKRPVSPMGNEVDAQQPTHQSAHSPRSSPKSQSSSQNNICTNSSPSDSESLKCTECGYIGQTTRGIKLHLKMHDCNYESCDEDNNSV